MYNAKIEIIPLASDRFCNFAENLNIKPMKLFPVIAEKFKLDGGASFGTVPKTIWQKQVKVDENNMVEVINRCLLIEDENRLILIDTGMGNKQSEKYFSHFYIFGNHSLERDILNLGYKLSDVTDVVLTHLHFDHCGGTYKYNEEQSELIPLFENAQYWCSQSQWNNSMNPNPREGNAYFKENFLPMQHNGKLNIIKENSKLTPNIELRLYNGHTFGQMLPFVKYKGRTLVFMADFIPSVFQVPVGYIAAFDIQPVVSMEEKALFLEEACEKDYILFFEHDINVECCTVKRTEKGIKPSDIFALNSI